jgi:ribosomal protein L11 methyltransferase
MKYTMPWSEVSVTVLREQTQQAELVLEQQGALAVTFEDALCKSVPARDHMLENDGNHPVLEPDPGTTPLWPSVHVRGLFEVDAPRDRITRALQSVPGISRPDLIRWCELDDQVWEHAWMDRFEPMKFGDHLWIVPTGMEIPCDKNDIEIRLDPGLAFGTGTHPTTALCLEWLDVQDVGGKRVVDYGCGSGILGIAAALKGAGSVICVDHDPQALTATRENATRNGVMDRVQCLAPEACVENLADIILANILAGPLMELAPVLLASVKPGGTMVLSGILEEQAGMVTGAYRAACCSICQQVHEGWIRLELQGLHHPQHL